MKIISHRGNIRGRVPGRENAPSYIDCALGNGCLLYTSDAADE